MQRQPPETWGQAPVFQSYFLFQDLALFFRKYSSRENYRSNFEPIDFRKHDSIFDQHYLDQIKVVMCKLQKLLQILSRSKWLSHSIYEWFRQRYGLGSEPTSTKLTFCYMWSYLDYRIKMPSKQFLEWNSSVIYCRI